MKEDIGDELEDIELDSLEDYQNNKKETKLINNNIFSSSLNPKLFDNKTNKTQKIEEIKESSDIEQEFDLSFDADMIELEDDE